VAGDIPALAYVSPGRLINTNRPLDGCGDLSAEELVYCLRTCAVTGSGLNQFAATSSLQLAGVSVTKTRHWHDLVFNDIPTFTVLMPKSQNTGSVSAFGKAN